MRLPRTIPDLSAGSDGEEERAHSSPVPGRRGGGGGGDLLGLRAQRESSCQHCRWPPNALTQRWEEVGPGAGVTGRVTPSIQERGHLTKRVHAVPTNLPSTLPSAIGLL
ncbi:hypothetical protein lerEdw1_016090 [Lerista edwardsae]|nr:hypothetical protein lerEdw1_016090 [Lerista edwardsae]